MLVVLQPQELGDLHRGLEQALEKPCKSLVYSIFLDVPSGNDYGHFNGKTMFNVYIHYFYGHFP